MGQRQDAPAQPDDAQIVGLADFLAYGDGDG
jgi:hypothetical protein